MAEDDISAAPATESTPASTPAESSPPPPSPSVETPAVPAAPDTGQTQSKESLLDAVLKVVPATTEKDVLAKPDDKPLPEGEQPRSTDQADKDAEEGSTPDDDETVPPDATPAIRKRIRKLLQQRREAHNELNVLRPAARIGTELEGFAKANNLSGQELAGGLKAIALYKAGDYQGFYDAIKPAIRKAQEYIGVVLPTDLDQMVKQGQMTEQAARVFARQRFDGQRSQAELQASKEAMARQRVQNVQSEVQQAVTNFELKLSASDPDYKAKAPSVRRAAQALLFERGGNISTVQEALQITKDAYAEVNKQMRVFRPQPVATHPQPNGSGSTPSVHAQPKSLYEAALQGLQKSRTGG